ncbi:MAG: hypothetical protein MNPFHGCM_02561 [Gemmatimonadaceae bacterium]|nr:hypothetical protein [Gemmatimonadaceae bacterium]
MPLLRSGQDTVRIRRDSASADSTGRDTSVVRDSVARDLTVDLLTRLEARGERAKNSRCFASQLSNSTFSCRARFAPTLNFQYTLRSSGTVADRFHVDVDYDSQREFDGSNNISLHYQGRPGQFLQRVDVGNVSFAPPNSRFLTSGIPSGNYGVQLVAQRSRLTTRLIVAQQKGNVVKDQVFHVGARTSQRIERDIDDYQIEPRRFFFTVDPALFGAAYPNLDLLDARQMAAVANALPDTVRPARVFLYRLILGGQPPNPNGPRFQLIGDPDSHRGQVYELLRENVDYYVDPSQLWVALVRPLALANERLVVAYTVRTNGVERTIPFVGGTPDLEYVPDRDQLAQLIWDPQVTPDHAAFRREIRSIYRLGGEDLRRESVTLRIVAGAGLDQEKPPGGAGVSYLAMFGVAQVTNPVAFDVENRVWPRPSDPNFAASGAAGARIIRDRFLVFPSLEPFARRGLAQSPTVPANDTLYRTPSEYLYSTQHPQALYRIHATYEVEATAGTGTIALNSIQLRPGSERISMDGRPLVREVDYTIDYDLGRVTLLRPDTLGIQAKRVVVRYEENPLFAAVPTSIIGLSSEYALGPGTIGIMALSQSQRSNLTRPTLGFEPQASLTAGVTADLQWRLPGLAKALGRVAPRADSVTTPRLHLRAELAVSQPRQRGAQQAYLESFESDGGVAIPLSDQRWEYSSQPSLGRALASRLGSVLDLSRAATLAFQANGTDRGGRAVVFRVNDVDTLATLVGSGLAPPEQMLWLTLYPLGIGGLRDPASGRYRWTAAHQPAGRRWRSIRTALGTGGSGVDLSRVEQIEFWTLVETDPARRRQNPLVVLDFGDVSENSVLIQPDTLSVAGADSSYTGRRVVGMDRLDSERDQFSRAFAADVNDLGLPGDRADSMTVFGSNPSVVRGLAVCTSPGGQIQRLGDSRANCTVGNNRLDEEDIDLDGALNLTTAQREQERIRRYVIDLADPAAIGRIGKCGTVVRDINDALQPSPTRCWVQVRIPFVAATDTIAGGPPLRRVRAVRVTVVSPASAADDEFVTIPLARFRLTGAAWLKRSSQPLRGIAGTEQSIGGYVLAASIGTQDRDSLRGLVYEPPPGVSDEAEQQQVFGSSMIQINERSMRLLAGGMSRYDRAEAFTRFAEGQRSVMTYRELRLWARGRGRGWGAQGDLQFYVKLGRDANNFYAYRTPINTGPGRSAWEPEIRVRFDKFYALRSRLQDAWLKGQRDSLGCSAADSALVAASGLPQNTRLDRYVACDDGYMVYTIDPAIAPPNLASVQEMAVGIVRVDSLAGADPPLPSDTAEVWVDDIRLASVVSETGYAAEIGATLDAGAFGTLRVRASRRDPHFRQLGEQANYLTSNDLEIAGTLQLERFLPHDVGISIPLTVLHTTAGATPLFLSRSDIRGADITDLRSPRSSLTTFTLGLRRRTPMTGPLAPLANNLGVNAVWNSNGNRSEFQTGRVRDFNVGIEYLGVSETPQGGAGVGQFVAAILGGAKPPGTALWPTSAHVSSNLERGTDRRESFLKPASAFDDTARVATGETYVWRTSTNIEFRPLAGVSARWDALTLRDLRNYAASPSAGLPSGLEQSRVAGLDLGFERERRMSASLVYAPVPAGWFRPRLDLGSSYNMLRDPNNRSFDTTGSVPTLARRFGNTQRISATAVIDLQTYAESLMNASPLTGRLLRAITPIDVSVTRDLLTAYDGARLSPSFGFQFGLGGIDAFRAFDGVMAASAGSATTWTLSNSVALPWGTALTGRVQHGTSRQWARQLAGRQLPLDGEQQLLPDVTLRWMGRPQLLSGILSRVGTSLRYVDSKQAFMAPPPYSGASAERRTTRLRSWPLTANAVTTWGNLTLSGAFARSERTDSLPGSVGVSSSSDLTTEVSRAFSLPESWDFQSNLRTRLSYQRSESQSYVSNVAAAASRSRLTDNGRTSFSFNADTDVADNMTFSVQGSRVVTFDRNFNRRFTQVIVSAVLQIQFFGGALR